MTKYALIIAACCLLVACRQAVKTTKQNQPDTAKRALISADSLIMPGAAIGQIKLNQDAADLINTLGKPDKADAAMGASLMTWYAGHDTTGYLISIYAHRNMGAADERVNHIKQVRITSPAFQTARQLRTGSLLDSIKKYYTLSGPKQNGVYDDVKAGIAFEITGKKCTAIVVHAPGDSSAAYIDMRE